MEFQKYQHIERFGTSEVENINFGKCFVFPKIDGTNLQCYLKDGQLIAGSRNRELTIDNDNQGSFAYLINNPQYLQYLQKHPNHRLIGEFLVKHTITTYREDAWNKYYIFDVIEEENENFKYLSYDEYIPLLEEFNIEFIPCIATIINGTPDMFTNLLDKNTYLIKDGEGYGEGIVIKNYEYHNKYNRVTWAKMVRNEFKEQHCRVMGATALQGECIEQKIIDKFCTEEFVKKEFAKININGWESKMIPKLLGIVWNTFIKEEVWNILKEFKNPIINFKTLNQLIIIKIKTTLKEIF